MSNLPRREKVIRESIDVEVGDFSHDRLYPDLNPELVGNDVCVTEDEYYDQLAAEEVSYQKEREEQYILEQAAFDDNAYDFE